MTNVLFACRQNAGRSQISRALFERVAGGRHAALSAGTEPADAVHPVTATVMAEAGVDLCDARPRLLTRELADWADVIVTMGCGDRCPYVPGKRYVEWALPDPARLSLEDVRELRDDVERRVRALVAQLDSEYCAATRP